MQTAESPDNIKLGFRTLVLSVVILISVASPAIATTGAQTDFSVGLDVPKEPIVGESTTISGSLSVPELTGDYEEQATVTLYIDGNEVDSQQVTVQDGETTTVSFSYTFESEGSHSVTVEGSVTLAGQTFSDSASQTIDVAQPSTPTVTLTPSTPTPIPTPSTETISTEGAAFPVPESLEDEVGEYRRNAPKELPGHAFVLATQDELYLVFTQTEPRKGIATVQGAVLDRELSHGNLTFGAVAATSASFETTGREASVQEVAANSGDYRLDLVRVGATYRRVSTLTDPDEGQNLTFSATSGILVADPQTASSLFQDAGTKAGTFSRDPSTDQIDRMLADPRGTHLHTVSFETEFWVDTEATVDAIVLEPGGAGRRFLSEFDQAGVVHSEPGEPVLYVVNEEFQPRSMDNVRSITTQSSSLDGEVVEVEARLYQERVSVQEMLEHNSPCGEDQLQVKEACINVVQDELLHGGVAWSEVPQSNEDLLWVLGVSSRHQDSPTELKKGRYRIVGEVVSTTRINESLPAGTVLLVYDLERVGAIDYEAVSAESRRLIENRSAQLTTNLRGQASREQVPATSGQDQQSVTGSPQSEVSASPSSDGTATGGNSGPVENPVEGVTTPGFTVASALAAFALLLLRRVPL